jgi:hypothetical protein
MRHSTTVPLTRVKENIWQVNMGEENIHDCDEISHHLHHKMRNSPCEACLIESIKDFAKYTINAAVTIVKQSRLT